MRIVIAIDSFKGCVSSLQAGEAAAKGLREILPKETQIMVYPVGDGGEGTLEALAAQHTGSMQFTEVNGPLGKKDTFAMVPYPHRLCNYRTCRRLRADATVAR